MFETFAMGENKKVVNMTMPEELQKPQATWAGNLTDSTGQTTKIPVIGRRAVAILLSRVTN